MAYALDSTLKKVVQANVILHINVLDANRNRTGKRTVRNHRNRMKFQSLVGVVMVTYLTTMNSRL